MAEVEIRKLKVSDWGLYKAIRIDALLDSPEAFGSSYEIESAYDDHKWQDILGASSIFVAFQDKIPACLVGSFSKTETPTECYLFSLWVNPTYRNQKIGKKLIEYLISWSKSQDATKIVAGYSDENIDSFGFYSKLGFVRTGEKKPLARDANIFEYIIQLEI